MKETHYKLKHRVTALFAAAVMLCSMLPGAAFAEEPTPQPTEETAQMEQQTEPSETDNGQTDESSPDPGEDVTEATPEAAEEQPAEEEIHAAVVGAELYTDLPNAPIGSYIGSEGLPVATGETKIGISEWPESQLEETSGSYLTAAALDNDGLTMAAPLLDGADYAIVPIMAQVEYPADGSTLDLVLPDSVTLLDYYGAPAADAESLLHSEYSETSAAVLGVYVQADANFTAQLVYTAPDGSALTKTLQVTIDRNATAEYPFPDSEIAVCAERPTPAVTSGKITKVAKVNGTWLIWFNGEPAYCCTHGANGQPAGLPPDTVQYIGIAADEPKRLARLKPGQISLLDKYHVAEPEARSMCAAEGLLSPLYDFTKRGGCWFCPNASISELRHLYRYHPELWQLLLELQDVPNKPTERFSWRRTFREIDERFRQEGEQLSFYEER